MKKKEPKKKKIIHHSSKSQLHLKLDARERKIRKIEPLKVPIVVLLHTLLESKRENPFPKKKLKLLNKSLKKPRANLEI